MNIYYPMLFINRIKKFLSLFTALLFSVLILLSCRQHVVDKPLSSITAPYILENINYKSGDNLTEYEKERCKLDLYTPEGPKEYPIVVWFHGGSFKRGSKDDELTKKVAHRFVKEGIGVAVVNYRLSPKAKYPAYFDDAAASIAWVKENITEYGGNNKSIFICGHSAGGYLVYMLVMNKKYLEKYNVNTLDVAGVIPIAGQTFTHYAIREERGIPNAEVTPIIDDASPCYYAQKITPPILAICADGDTPDRIGENKYFMALLSTIGNNQHSYYEVIDRTHWSLIKKIPEQNDPLFFEIISFINKHN